MLGQDSYHAQLLLYPGPVLFTRWQGSVLGLLILYLKPFDVVIVKVHDCRIYHACGSDHVVREYSEKSAPWDELQPKHEIATIVTPELIEPHLTLIKAESDFVRFSSK